jgi:hypothetical protein
MSSAPPGALPAKGSSAAQLLSKTCQNCFSLKIRCDRTQRQDICDRWALNKFGYHMMVLSSADARAWARTVSSVLLDDATIQPNAIRMPPPPKPHDVCD